jgi:hypothetical protein
MIFLHLALYPISENTNLGHFICLKPQHRRWDKAAFVFDRHTSFLGRLVSGIDNLFGLSLFLTDPDHDLNLFIIVHRKLLRFSRSMPSFLEENLSGFKSYLRPIFGRDGVANQVGSCTDVG